MTQNSICGPYDSTHQVAYRYGEVRDWEGLYGYGIWVEEVDCVGCLFT